MLFSGAPEKRSAALLQLSPEKIAGPQPKRVLSEQNSGFTHIKSGQNVLKTHEDTLKLQENDSLSSDIPQKAPQSRDALPTELPYKDLVIQSFYKTQTGVQVVCHSSKDPSDQVKVLLQGFWAQTPLTNNLLLRLFAPNLDCSEFVVNDEQNFVILSPDTLVMCTSIASGCYCRRKVVFSERFRGGCDPGNKVMLAGTIVHCLFQTAVRISPDDVSDRWLDKQLNRLAFEDISVIQQLIALQWTPADFLKEARAFYPHIKKWCSTYLGSIPTSPFPRDPKATITGIRDIEENIWCTRFGLRGKVDLSLESGGKQKVVPLELKTGKSSCGADHKGQVLLYTLMLSSVLDQSDPIIRDGLLMYVKDGSTHPVRTSFNAIRGLLQLRNDMAFYLTNLVDNGRPFQLPEPIDDRRFCQSCPQLLTCAIWQRTFECDRTDFMRNDTMRKLVPSVLGHLRDVHLEFFAGMTEHILNEWHKARETRPQNSDAWNVSSEIREQIGNCIGSLRMTKVIPVNRGDSFSVTFCKSDQSNLPEKCFTIGSMVMVSSESRNHTTIFMGPVTTFNTREVTVTVDRRPQRGVRRDIFRLDSYQSFTSFQYGLANLLRLLMDSEPCAHLRSALIDDASPTFAEKLTSSLLCAIKPILKKMDRNQIRMIIKVLATNHYLLLQSGNDVDVKHVRLAEIIHVLLVSGNTILLTAFSNFVLDETLVKLVQNPDFDNNKILRLGSTRQINSCVKDSSIEGKLSGLDGDLMYNAVCNVFDSTPLVACTTSTAANHLLFSRRRFDYVIIDEAEKTNIAAALGPLLVGGKFILVAKEGKDEKENTAKEFDATIFEFLKQKHGDTIVKL